MVIDSSFSCDSVIWIKSLPPEDEGITNRIIEDLEPLLKTNNRYFECWDVNSVNDLVDALSELVNTAREHEFYPLLHLDMHGDEEKGIYIEKSKEYMPWNVLCDKLRELNNVTNNNLCIILTACFSLNVIKSINKNELTPFFVLIAPEKTVDGGFLATNILEFYRILFSSGSIDLAYNQFLKDKFHYYHCEKTLFMILARYILKGCKGRSARERRERLLTELMESGVPNTKSNLKSARQTIKKKLIPEQSLVERYAKKFLGERKVSFNIEDILKLIG
ncbi:hypothetical protein [Providencia sp. PROV032]|uniref:hypothetical protein n=1 Tax=Providencia sp. PROV032 TaxID=2949764 RepID=UPI00234B3063|nr:hypothetical protein [Providencia sp. PROV032]